MSWEGGGVWVVVVVVVVGFVIRVVDVVDLVVVGRDGGGVDGVLLGTIVAGCLAP